MNAIANFNPINLNTSDLNPYSSRFVSPPTCTFIQDPTTEINPDEIVKQLTQSRCLQIVGPHGCGKTTLAIQIAKNMRHTCKQIRTVTIQPNRDWGSLPKIFAQPVFSQTSQRPLCHSNYDDRLSLFGLTIVDGIESLPAAIRFCLVQSLKRSRGYAIFTVHRPTWLVRSRITLKPSFQQFRRIAMNLTAQSAYQPSEELLQAVYSRSDGNYRDATSLLYDEFAA